MTRKGPSLMPKCADWPHDGVPHEAMNLQASSASDVAEIVDNAAFEGHQRGLRLIVQTLCGPADFAGTQVQIAEKRGYMRINVQALVLSVAMIAVGFVAPAQAHAPTPAAPMQSLAGPFASLEKACASVSCPAVDIEGNGQKVPAHRACGGAEEVHKMPNPPVGFADVQLYPINCRVPGLRDGNLAYRLAVRRADGWWLSTPLATVGGNDKYCDGRLAVRWEVRTEAGGASPLLIIHGGAITDCVACSKQGEERTGLNLLIVARDVPGKAPVIWGPLVIGEHLSQTPDSDDAEDCPKTKSDTDLHLAWTADGTLEVTGPATWSTVQRSTALGVFGFAGKPEPTPVGRHRFDLAK